MNLRNIKLIRNLTNCPYTVDDLKLIPEMPIRELRQKSQIVIIDDQIDTMAEIVDGLRRNAFNVKTRKDVESVQDVEPYDIVISDVQGVATGLDQEEEGYGFIRQVAKNYPLKGIGVYSGISYTLKSPIPGMMVIQKDDGVQTWCDIIDSKLLEIKDPALIWAWMARKMVDGKIPAKTIAKVEDDYVYRVINNKSMEGFPSVNLGNESVVNSLSLAARMLSVGMRGISMLQS